jgi:hypothetical protein
LTTLRGCGVIGKTVDSPAAAVADIHDVLGIVDGLSFDELQRQTGVPLTRD